MNSLIKYEDDFYEKFFKDLSKVNKKAYDFIQETILTKDYNVNNIEEKIRMALKSAGYGNLIESLFSALDGVDDITTGFYKKRELGKVFAESNRVKLFRDVLSDNLRGGGVNEAYIKKISNTVRQSFFNNSPQKNIFNSIKSIAGESGVLSKYVQQVSYDTVSQYSGVLQAEIQDKYKPQKGMWIGDLIETSRPICICLYNEQKKNGFISSSFLEKTLLVYIPNGIPDDILGSGMIAGTDFSNFAKLRGGYRCRHKWIWLL